MNEWQVEPHGVNFRLVCNGRPYAMGDEPSLRYLCKQLNEPARKAAPDMLEALKGVMHLIESGYLVRNIGNDADPDWAINQLGPVLVLQKAAAALAAAEPEGK